MITEMVARVHEADPVEGNWCVDSQEMKVQVDASSVATGVVLEVNGNVIKDAFWLCPTGDTKIVNLVELDTTLKSVNLALQWWASRIHLLMDSACVHCWISSP